MLLRIGFLALLFASNVLSAQQIVKDKTYTTNNITLCSSICATPDKGFLVAGLQGTNFKNVKNVVFRFNRKGDTLWKKTFEKDSRLIFPNIIRGNNQTYTIFSAVKPSGQALKAYIANINLDGSVNWENTFGMGFGTFIGKEIKRTESGNYIAVVSSPPFTNGSADDAFLVKLNSKGDTLWTKRFSNDPSPYLPIDVAISNDGYLMLGTSDGLRIVKTDKQGNELWTRQYGQVSEDLASVVKTADNGYILCSATDSLKTTKSAIYLLKLNAKGKLVWKKTISTSGKDYALSAIKDKYSKDKYHITGSTDPDSNQISNFYYASIDGKGNIIQEKVLSKKNKMGYDLTYSTKGDLLLLGGDNLFTGNPFDTLRFFELKQQNAGTPKKKRPNLSISPIPVNGQKVVTIRYNHELSSVKFYTVNGRQVLRKTGIHADNAKVDATQLSNGVYFVIAETKDGRTKTKKVVIQGQ